MNKELDGKDNDEVHDEDDNEDDTMMVKIIIIYETDNDNEYSMKMMVTSALQDPCNMIPLRILLVIKERRTGKESVSIKSKSLTHQHCLQLRCHLYRVIHCLRFQIR